MKYSSFILLFHRYEAMPVRAVLESEHIFVMSEDHTPVVYKRAASAHAHPK